MQVILRLHIGFSRGIQLIQLQKASCLFPTLHLYFFFFAETVLLENAQAVEGTWVLSPLTFLTFYKRKTNVSSIPWKKTCKKTCWGFEQERIVNSHLGVGERWDLTTEKQVLLKSRSFLFFAFNLRTQLHCEQADHSNYFLMEYQNECFADNLKFVIVFCFRFLFLILLPSTHLEHEFS